MSPATSDDTCARCGAAFRCGMADAAPCWCTAVRLDAAVLAGLAQRHAGCLCPACLAALAAGAAPPADRAA